MANPTLGWDTIPVYGWWSDNPGIPSKGDIHLMMEHRVRRVDGRMIYPGGARRTLRIGDKTAHDPLIRDAVHDAMKARDMAAQGGSFDEAAWELRWERNLDAAIFTSFWAADDPDITPHGAGDEGYHVAVSEALEASSGKKYDIQPLIAHLDLPIPGINLADIDPPPGSPSVPAPIYAKSQPGGIAALDAEGDVVNAAGMKVGQVDPAEIESAVGTYLHEHPIEVDGLPEGGSPGQYPSRDDEGGAVWVDLPAGGGPWSPPIFPDETAALAALGAGEVAVGDIVGIEVVA